MTTPLEPDAIYWADGTEAVPAPPDPPETQARQLWWHVFGGPIKGTRRGKNNYPLFTAGPVRKPADAEVTGQTIEGSQGETFRYLGSFDHEPSDSEINLLKPKEYR